MTEKLNREQQKRLFGLARHAVESYLKGEPAPSLDTSDPVFQEKRGVFVTLRRRGGELRGCIGTFSPDNPLYEAVSEMAVAAAFGDPRFPPVTREELRDLQFEISVLSPMQRVQDPLRQIQLGKHGVYIKKGLRSGTFLPQVATETGWTREEFLGHCSQDKAGLGWDGWKTAEVFVYTADIYEEKECDFRD